MHIESHALEVSKNVYMRSMMMLMGKAGYLRERLLCRVPLSSTSPLISGVPSSTDIAGMAVRWRE